MILYELLIGVNLKKNVTLKDMSEEMSKSINILFLTNDRLKELHERNEYKLYTYSGLFPLEKDKLYKKGIEYLFKIRFLRKDMAREFEDLLYDVENPLFKTLRVVSSSRNITGQVEKLYTLTPAVITMDKKNWTKDTDNNDLSLVKERIINNTIHKYNFLNNTSIPVHDFIESIQMTNRLPMVFNYKTGVILANKFRISIKQDELSQELATVILGAGLLEKNSLSFGFCLPNREELV